MSGADAPEIREAYDAVRSNTSPTNYLILSYSTPTTSLLTLSATGTGGISELAETLDPTQAQYAYVRVEYANDKESTREKFVFITWIGEECKAVMRKARVSIESGAVKQALSHHSIAVTAGSKKDLIEDDIVKRCREVGGADYNGGRG